MTGQFPSVSCGNLRVHYSFWQPCNSSSDPYFATFPDTSSQSSTAFLPELGVLRLIIFLNPASDRKIDFSGNEPAHYLWLDSLIRYNKALGLTEYMVASGYRVMYEGWTTPPTDSASPASAFTAWTLTLQSDS